MKTLKILRKRGFALFLALVMCLGLSVPAFAAGVDITIEVVGEQKEQYAAGDQITIRYATSSKEIGGLVLLLPNGNPSAPSVSYNNQAKDFTYTYTVPEDAYGTLTFTAEFRSASGAYTSKTLSLQGPEMIEATGISVGDSALIVTGLGEENKSYVWWPKHFSITLQPEDATDAVFAVRAESDDESIVKVGMGTYSSDGRNVDFTLIGQKAGNTTLTLTVTTENRKTFTAKLPVTVNDNSTPDPVETEDYTFTIAEADNKTSVNIGETVTMNVTLDKAANFAAAEVTYDTDVFELTNGSTWILKADEVIDAGEALAALTFKAIAIGEAEFGFSTAKAANSANIPEGEDAPEAAKNTATVTVTNAPVIVTFVDESGSTEVKVAYGATLEGKVPKAAEKAHHDFTGWMNGDAELDETAPVTEAVTYTAVYTPKTYTVDVGKGLTGETTATYGEDYTGSIADYDGDNYNYVVKYTINGEEKEATVDEDGNYTIPGTEIIGDVAISVEKTSAFDVEVYEDYVTGYTLVLVHTTDGEATAKGYTYAGSDMYFVENHKAYGWIVEGALTVEQAKAQVAIGDGSCETLNRGTDVNNSGKTDLYDMAAVTGCYRVQYDMATNMARYLCADVTGDHRVNTADLNRVQNVVYPSANP